MLFKLTVLGHPTDLDIGRARAYVLAVGAVGGLDIFSLANHFSSFSLSLGDSPI